MNGRGNQNPSLAWPWLYLAERSAAAIRGQWLDPNTVTICYGLRIQRNAPKWKRNSPKRPAERRAKLSPDKATLRRVQVLAQIHCSLAEAASVLLVSRKTFEQFLREHPKACQAWERGRALERVSLRRLQFLQAAKRPAMAIWLGKQILGQKDPDSKESDRKRRSASFMALKLAMPSRHARTGSITVPDRGLGCGPVRDRRASLGAGSHLPAETGMSLPLSAR